MSSDPVPYADRLRERIDAIRKNQSWVAEHSGLDKSTVSRLLSGTRNPTLEQAQCLATLFGDTVEAHLRGTDAEERLVQGAEYVHRSALRAAIAKLAEYESKNTELELRAADLTNAVKAADARAKAELKRAEDATRRGLALARDVERLTQETRELNAALKRAHLKLDRQETALAKAATEITALRGHIKTLIEQGVETGKSSKLGSILSGIAASAGLVTVGMLLSDAGSDASDSNFDDEYDYEDESDVWEDDPD